MKENQPQPTKENKELIFSKEMENLQAALRVIDPNIIVTNNLEFLEPKREYTWKKVGEIHPGERVSWWTDDVEVRGVKQEGPQVLITVFDPRSSEKGEERTFSYKVVDELRVKDKSDEV